MKPNDMVSTSGSKGRWSRLPLKVKLIAYFLIFAIIMLVFLWLFQIVFLDDFYRLIKTEQLRQSTHSVAERIGDEDLREYMDAIYERNDVSAAVFDTTSDLFIRVYATRGKHNLGVEIMPHEVYSYYQAAKREGGQVLADKQSDEVGGVFFEGQIPMDDYRNADTLACAEVVTGENGKEYMVVEKIRITPVTSTVDTLRIQLIIITGILLIFSVVFAVVVSQKLSKPITKQSEGAKELARHNYDVRFDSQGCKEICELSETLNVAAAELSTVDRLRRELIANISHDLRTPLTMISGYAEVMRDIPGENTSENLQVIIDESKRLSSLVTDLMDLSKLESSAVPVSGENFCITDSIRDIFSRYAKLISQEGYRFEFISDCDVQVFGDEIRLSQVIYNLINNAVNYCGDDKTVIVRQILSDNKVRIEVEDHGKGISAEDLEHIWDRYYRVDKEHRSAVIGTGLGLSIAKNVLELHKARFGVISRAGAGSTFWFELDAAGYSEKI